MFSLFHYLLSINDVNALGQCRSIGAKVATAKVVDVFTILLNGEYILDSSVLWFILDLILKHKRNKSVFLFNIGQRLIGLIDEKEKSQRVVGQY